MARVTALFVMGLQRGNIRTALAVPMLHAQKLGVECAVVDAAHEAGLEQHRTIEGVVGHVKRLPGRAHAPIVEQLCDVRGFSRGSGFRRQNRRRFVR